MDKKKVKNFTARLPATLVRKIDKVAQKNGRSRNEEMSRLLKYSLECQESAA